MLVWPAGLAVLLTICGFWQYTPDDGFIHLTFIRNLARTGAFVFAGEKASYGDTSPLWVLINAIPVSLGASAMATAKTVGFLCGTGALWAAVLLASRLGGPVAGALAGALLLFDPWVLRWTESGLETPLGVAVLLCAVLALQMRRWSAASVLAGLAPLVRPDFVPFTALVGFVLLRQFLRGPRQDLTRSRWLGSIALLLAPGLIWAAYAYGAFGTVVPNTVKVKSLLYDKSLVAWLKGLAPILASSHAIALAALGATLVLRSRSTSPRIDGNVLLVLFAWPALLFGGYALSRSAVASRYFLPATTFLYVAAAWILAARSRRLAVAVVVSSCLVSAGLIAWRVKPEINTYTRNFVQARTLPAWLNQHASSRDVVAAGDIGYLGFYNEVGYNILDLAGLVSPEMIGPPAARAARIRAIRPRFAVERESVENAVAAGRGLPMTGLDANEARRIARLRIAAFLGYPAMQLPRKEEWYSLYELDWNLLDASTGPEASHSDSMFARGRP